MTAGEPAETERSVLGSSAVMAAGTVVSRLSGYVRSTLLLAALGTYLHADVFSIANTVPNMLYILLAGGVFNAVLVPQLVRAMKQDADGGEAYTNRIITLAGLFLAGVTAVLVVAAPLLMQLYLANGFDDPSNADARSSAVTFARFCLPQVFFYGMFVLVGQVLNSRQRFGPMMWAPIANNVIAISVLVIYLFAFGPADDAERTAGYTGGQEVLLGLGSTVGIVVQLLVLLPYLKSAGFHYKPRFDFKGTGLGHTLRLGVWTVLFVVVNQIAYTVVTRIASSGTADGGPGAGFTIYSSTFLVVMAPHAIATVSLATATLPRLSAYAAEQDLAAVGRQVAATMRTALSLILPFALVLPVIALPVANIVSKYGAAADSTEDFARTLSLFAIGLVFFTSHYLVLRGFYALERTRTVFWVQCLISAVNIALAVALTASVDPLDVAPRLALAYAGAYLVGSVASYLLLRAILGGLESDKLVRFLVRMVVAGGIAALATWGVRELVEVGWPEDGSKLQAVVMLGLMGVVDLGLLALLARLMRIDEVNELVGLVTRRLRR
ncbi:MAG TPA: murein biosynthesis integral membrane protein MurJ [Nocardioidaceae bacterium]|nr:murein biosynthesis integral membrane protein MurJ [Nocardioidaceae bacterium]